MNTYIRVDRFAEYRPNNAPELHAVYTKLPLSGTAAAADNV